MFNWFKDKKPVMVERYSNDDAVKFTGCVLYWEDRGFKHMLDMRTVNAIYSDTSPFSIVSAQGREHRIPISFDRAFFFWAQANNHDSTPFSARVSP